MKSIYDSGFHHPLAAYVANVLLLMFVLAEGRAIKPLLRAYLVVFGLEILADACVTGAWSPIASSSPWYSPLSILFVILGDLRYFVFASRVARPDDPLGRHALVATAIALVVPVATGVMSRVIPIMGSNPRVLFLVYELMLVVVVALFRARTLATATAASEAARTWIRRVSAFELVQYVGWALADVVILTGHDVGYLLRILPNVMYYAGFLVLVCAEAPRTERAE